VFAVSAENNVLGAACTAEPAVAEAEPRSVAANLTLFAVVTDFVGVCTTATFWTALAKSAVSSATAFAAASPAGATDGAPAGVAGVLMGASLEVGTAPTEGVNAAMLGASGPAAAAPAGEFVVGCALLDGAAVWGVTGSVGRSGALSGAVLGVAAFTSPVAGAEAGDACAVCADATSMTAAIGTTTVAVGVTGTADAAVAESAGLSAAFLSAEPGVCSGVAATCTGGVAVVASGCAAAAAELLPVAVVSGVLFALVLVVCALEVAGLLDGVAFVLAVAGAVVLEVVDVGDAGVVLLDAGAVCAFDDGVVDCAVVVDGVLFWAGVEAVPLAASLRSES
jgi:hypothetical protein